MEEGHPGILAVATRVAGRVGSASLVPSLAHLLSREPDPVAAEVMAALGWIRDPSATHPLVRGLGADHRPARHAAVRELWTLPRREVQEMLERRAPPLGDSLEEGAAAYRRPLPSPPRQRRSTRAQPGNLG